MLVEWVCCSHVLAMLCLCVVSVLISCCHVHRRYRLSEMNQLLITYPVNHHHPLTLFPGGGGTTHHHPLTLFPGGGGTTHHHPPTLFPGGGGTSSRGGLVLSTLRYTTHYLMGGVNDYFINGLGILLTAITWSVDPMSRIFWKLKKIVQMV